MAVDPIADIAASYRPASAALVPHAMRQDLPGWERAQAQGEGQSFGFADFLDMINPLQHLPVVGTLYRALTGDAMAGPARIVGDVIYGGPLGLITGIVDAQLQASTGADMGGHVMAMLTGEPVGAPAALDGFRLAGDDGADTAALAAQAQAVAPLWLASAPSPAPEDAEEAPEPVMDLPAVRVPEVEVYQDLVAVMNANLDRYQAQQSGTAVDANY